MTAAPAVGLRTYTDLGAVRGDLLAYGSQPSPASPARTVMIRPRG